MRIPYSLNDGVQNPKIECMGVKELSMANKVSKLFKVLYAELIQIK